MTGSGNDSENTRRPKVVFLPDGVRGEARAGETLLGTARRLGADIDSACGGRGICGRCQVSVMEGTFAKEGITSSPDHLSPPTEAEQKYARIRGLAPGRRLSCQARVTGDVVIDVPVESRLHRQLVRKMDESLPIAVDPLIRAVAVEVAPPDLHEPSSDFARLALAVEEETGEDTLSADLPVLTGLQRGLRAGSWQVTAVLHQRHERDAPRLIDVRPGFDERLYGLAVDIGSTTIAAHLVDLHDGSVLASAGCMNPQIRFGEDLMSRVSWAMMNENGAQEMTTAVRAAINDLARTVCERARVRPEQILDSAFVGNPVMHHLFLGIDPRELGQAPFPLAVAEALELPARELDLAFAPAARAYILPCIAGHVGADAAAVILAEAPHEREDISLIVDVGTNAEIVLGNRERLLACSSPTGPALEGAQISCGQRAAPGAIERVRIDPETFRARYKVIGAEPWSDEPGFEEAVKTTGVTGICGSGIIEAIAEMYLAGIIDESGRFNAALAERTPFVKKRGRDLSYVLRPAGDGMREIAITQEDVRAVQLAKAALHAGCKLLMEAYGIETVDRIRLAGAFGAHIDPLYALILGMIPDCPLENVTAAGNAAGTGARMALCSREARDTVEALVKRIEKIETAVEPRFQEHFVAAMAFPHASDPYPNLRRHIRLPEPGSSRAQIPEKEHRRRRRQRQRQR
ncbi:ASKHA domain-containing protein [Thermopetrobacter sp. TC1]|uniref:ASKHA domain-containing protein n=1 Tax=Thermopetrobacter sp. TC1 TaxID=1495045 RepID=UPI00056EE754|nr:ASKHA domain-containing protein [Thermopetrobacter sp. TC1]